VADAGQLAVVTGGTGAVGRAVVERLVREGMRVRVCARRAAAALPAGVEMTIADVTRRADMDRALGGADVVFHLAAKLHINAPAASLEAEYRSVNVVGTQNVIEAARRAGTSRVVVFSTISVYGPSSGGEVFTEASPARPGSLYARTKHEAELVALEAGALASVLRLAAVYGPTIKGNYATLARAVRSGWFLPVGRGANRRTLVFDADVAGAALLAARDPRAAGRIYNVTDGAIHTFADVLAAIREAAGRRGSRLHLPVAPVRVAGRALDGALALAGREPRVGPMLDKLLEDVAVDGRLMQDALGFRPSYDLARGWRAALGRP
jgi:UDP-glucose 4-epimerase